MELRALPAVGLASVLTALLAPAAVAGPRDCHAQNVASSAEFSQLADAIAAASPGDTIEVSGTCHGNFAVANDLTLQGRGTRPTLDGDYGGRVLTITSGTTTLRDLKVTHGKMTGRGPENAGGGIYVGTAAVLDGVLVSENSADRDNFGGGIEADFHSKLTVTDSVVRENTAGNSGGIDMFRAKATLINSVVTDNTAKGASIDGCAFGDNVYSCAGGIWNYHGTLALSDSAVTENRAGYRGGGIRNDATFAAGVPTDGVVILGGSTAVSSNWARNAGGGIFALASGGANPNGSVQAADGTPTYLDPVNNTTLPAWTGTVSANHPDQCSAALTIGTFSCD